jgi:hypothetical protein
VHNTNFPKNLRATSRFQAPGEQQEANKLILGLQLGATVTQFSRHGDMVPLCPNIWERVLFQHEQWRAQEYSSGAGVNKFS